MAELATIARPYAEAAFEIARDANALGPWSEMLRFASQVVADPRVAEALDNPRLDAAARESLLLSIAGDRFNYLALVALLTAHAARAGQGPEGALAWLAWAIAAAACVQLAPSPVMLTLVIAVCWLVVEAHAPDGPYRRAFPALIALGVVFGLFRVTIAALTTHNGIDVWFVLPHFTMPDILGGFTVGGSVEAGVVLQSLASSYTVVGMMAVFGAANALWSHYELVQSTPRAFHELGVVVTVALAFVPATIAFPNSFSTSATLPANAASMSESRASADASATTAITSSISTRSFPCA